MNILIISDDFLPAATGVGIHLNLIFKELVLSGHNISVITTRRKGEPEVQNYQGATIYRTKTICIAGFYQAIPSQKKLMEIFKLVQPEVVHFHYLGFLLIQAQKIAKKLKIPQIYTNHMTVDHLTQPFFMRPFRHIISGLIVKHCNQFDLILCPSKNLMKELPKTGIFTPIEYLSNPVSFGDISSVVPFCRGNEFTVLFVGRYEPEKNVAYLLAGFKKLLEQKPNSILWLAGRGSEEKMLKQMAIDLGISDKTHFLGFLDHQSLARRYAACDVFVLPALVEVQPLVALEAMWFGRPIIVTKAIVAAEEMVEDGVNGYIVDPEKSDDLADRLNNLCSNPLLLKKFGAEGIRRVSTCRPEIVMNQLLAVYQKFSLKVNK